MNVDSASLQIKRQQFIDLLVAQVERAGTCEFTGQSYCMDDPPERPILEVARLFEEGQAEREGRRPHLEAPRTLMGELKKACDERGWPIEWEPKRCIWLIIAPVQRRECRKCGGRGQIFQPTFLVLEPIEPSQMVQVYRCDACEGRGYKESRVA